MSRGRAANPEGRVVVLGAAGMLGVAMAHTLRRMGFSVVGVDRGGFDPLRQPLSSLPLGGARAVVNCLGLINRRVGPGAEADFWRVNAVFPRQLADLCQAQGVGLVHISTDCVFNGEGAPHDELAAPDATDLYGASKAAGEPANALVLRSSIIGPEWRHHYSLLCWLLQQQGTVTGYPHHRWNGVTTLELSRVVGLMLQAGDDAPGGVRHIHGEDLTKLGLLQTMAEVLGHPVQVAAVEHGPPRDTRLCTRHGLDLARWQVKPMREQLMDLRPWCGPQGQWLGDPPSGDNARHEPATFPNTPQSPCAAGQGEPQGL